MSLLKKIKLITLSCIAGTSLVACNSSQDLKAGIEDPVEILTFAKSVNIFDSTHNQISTSIKSNLNNQPLDINILFDTLYSSKEEKSSVTTSISIGENENKASIYLAKDGDIPYKYTKKDNSWVKEELSGEQFNNILLSSSEPMYFDELISKGNAFTVKEDESNYTLDGKVKISDIEETLQYVGALNMLSTINMNIEEIDKNSDVSLTLQIEKGTGYLKNATIDIIDAANESLAKTIIDLVNLPLDAFKLEIKEFKINLAFDQPNSVENIEVPQKALNAQ